MKIFPDKLFRRDSKNLRPVVYTLQSRDTDSYLDYRVYYGPNIRKNSNDYIFVNSDWRLYSSLMNL